VRILTSKRGRDYLGGVLMMALGLGAAVQGSTYSIGTLSRMGPGFFPVALGVILALAGLAIAVTARFEQDAVDAKAHPPEWRAWFCICASIVAFVVLGKYGGLVPATFAIVFISALGDRGNTIASAALLAVSCVVVALVVFHFGLQLQFPLFQWGA
jgi:putative tricarboxylic transport membrane protein